MEKELFDILACPDCKGDLEYNEDKTCLLCKGCGKVYKIQDGIPILMD